MISTCAVVSHNEGRRVKNSDYKALRKKVLALHPARRRYFFAIMRGREWNAINCQEALELARETKPAKCDELLGWFSHYANN